MQNSGNLAELPLEGILETVQRDRATGTLHLTTDQGQATLFFLFGHLFHAIDGEREGEPVVYDALDWHDGEFTFDSKAKLPAEETIKVSTSELLAARQNGGSPEGATAPLADPEVADADQTMVSTPASDDDAENEPEEETEEAAATVNEDEADADVVEESEEGAEAEAEHPMRRATDARPDIRPPETMQLYPVPLGKLIYEALTAGFVDFPKLLRSLSKDAHSGYVRLSGDGFSSVLLFSNGAVVEAIYDTDGEVATGENAFRLFGKHIDDGEGVLDVISLSPEMVTGMYQLLTGPSMYEGLLARFVKADALIEYLQEVGHSGALIARNEKRSGIVLFRDGQLLGSYTDSAREVDPDPLKVLAVCKEPTTEIEVRGGEVPETLPVMEPGEGPREVPSGSPGGFTPPPAPSFAPEAGVAEAPAGDGGAPAPAANGDVDWPSVINEMAGRADAVLGTRSKKVKELLYATSHSRPEVEGTIEKISELSIMFVDPSKLTALADDMRNIVAGAA